MDDKSGKQAIEYGLVPIDVMASMSGLDFVRAIFARRLPEPPIMQTVEPFDCTVEPGAVVIHSVWSVEVCSWSTGGHADPSDWYLPPWKRPDMAK